MSTRSINTCKVCDIDFIQVPHKICSESCLQLFTNDYAHFNKSEVCSASCLQVLTQDYINYKLKKDIGKKVKLDKCVTCLGFYYNAPPEIPYCSPLCNEVLKLKKLNSNRVKELLIVIAIIFVYYAIRFVLNWV